MTNPVDAILGNRRRDPSMAQVVSTDASEGSCTVLLADGEVDARLADHLLLPGPVAAVAAGDVVALLPIGDTYLVIASVGSSAGAGGTAPSLGPNLLPNPGFEFGATQPDGWSWTWINEGVTASRDTAPGEPLAGNARGLQTLTVGAARSVAWITVPFMVDPVTTYRASVWVKASAVDATALAQITIATGATAETASSFLPDVVASVASPGSAYQLILGDYTIPSGHGWARLFLSVAATPASDLAVSWDEAAFQQRITT